jgi:hypothetical protein
MYLGYDVEEYQPLLHLPTKASNDYYSLEDIVANGQGLSGEHINILAILKKVTTIFLSNNHGTTVSCTLF